MEAIQLIRDLPTRTTLLSIRQSIPAIIAQQIQQLIDSGAFAFPFQQNTTSISSVPSPSQFAIYVQSRQALGLGDIVYFNLQKSNGQWDWFQVIKAT